MPKCPLAGCGASVCPTDGRGKVCSRHGREFQYLIDHGLCAVCTKPNDGDGLMCGDCVAVGKEHGVLK